MINKFFCVVKNFVVSALLIYAYDYFIISSFYSVSINLFNVLFVTFFGFVGMFYLILFSFI